MLKGIALHQFDGTLLPVADNPILQNSPVLTYENIKRVVDEKHEGQLDDLVNMISYKPLEELLEISFDLICKLYFSKRSAVCGNLRHLFEYGPNPHRLISKIYDSMWCWGKSKPTWNELVCAFTGLQQFSFGDELKDFEIRLDFSSGHNKMGYAEFSRTFLDGSIALLIYYKGEHVMTVSFTFRDGQTILLRQVQLAKEKGNRWLFKFPPNRLEFVLERMKQAFPDYDLYLVDGGKLVRDIIANYRRSMQVDEQQRDEYRNYAQGTSPGTVRDEYDAQANELDAHIRALSQRIASLKKDRPRLERLYNDTGRFQLKQPCETWGADYRLVA